MANADDADTERMLAEWSARLTEELALEGLEVDIDAILGLAGVAAHAVVRPAAPLTTFIVGYAAGRAAAQGTLPSDAAIAAATATALELAGRESGGETATATSTRTDE